MKVGQDYSYLTRDSDGYKRVLVIQTRFEKTDFTRREIAEILENTAKEIRKLDKT